MSRGHNFPMTYVQHLVFMNQPSKPFEVCRDKGGDKEALREQEESRESSVEKVSFVLRVPRVSEVLYK